MSGKGGFSGQLDLEADLKIFSVASFIVGMPGETPRERSTALDSALTVAPDAAQFVPFYPFPGVPMAATHQGFDPAPDAVRDAKRFTAAFYENAEVRKRLLFASRDDGIRALLARSTLQKYGCDLDRRAGLALNISPFL